MEEGSNTIGVDARHGTVTSITARSSEAMDPGIAGLYSYMDTEFFRATLPLIRSLQICGLFYPKEYGKGVLPGETQRVGRRRGRVSPWKVYSILVVGLLSLNSLRMFAIFQTDEDFGPSILLKILWTSWMISCTVNSIACFYACHRYQCLPQFFLSWKDLDQEANAECIQHLRPRILICAIVGWIVASTNVGVAIYGLFFSGRGIFDFTIVPLKPTSIYSTAARIIYLVVHIYMSVAWSMVSAYAFIFCAALCKQFTLLGTEFRQKVNHEDGSFSGDLEHFRCRHQRLSRMVGNVDGFLRIYIASVYTQTIAGLCIIMYNLLYDKEMVSDAMLLSIHVFWCGGLAASLSILSVPAAMVSHAVSTYILPEKPSECF